MYRGKKISIAIATYNGEKYFEEQLDSIGNQSILPDEIIISDDGSLDKTVEKAQTFRENNKQIDIQIIRDNPRKGNGGNFEWAIKHTTGDIIFICAQDDIWCREKIEYVTDVFCDNPEAELVCHNLDYIDGDSNSISNVYGDANSFEKIFDDEKGKSVKIERKRFLAAVVSGSLISGAAVCISKEIRDKYLPIPCDMAEDRWLEFCALRDDEMYYTSQVLTKYRIHNSTVHSTGLSLKAKFEKNKKRVKTARKGITDLMKFSKSIIMSIDEDMLDKSEFRRARITANSIYNIAKKQEEAISKGRIIGSIKLVKLFLTNVRYRKSGTGSFVVLLLNILIYGKGKTNEY